MQTEFPFDTKIKPIKVLDRKYKTCHKMTESQKAVLVMIKNAQAGSMEALEDLLEHSLGTMNSIANGYPYIETQDALQELRLEICAKLHKYNPERGYWAVFLTAIGRTRLARYDQQANVLRRIIATRKRLDNENKPSDDKAVAAYLSTKFCKEKALQLDPWQVKTLSAFQYAISIDADEATFQMVERDQLGISQPKRNQNAH